MGTLFGLGIDNAIEIDEEEVPILDGSAKVYRKLYCRYRN